MFNNKQVFIIKHIFSTITHLQNRFASLYLNYIIKVKTKVYIMKLKLQFIFCMLVFGSIGIFVKQINMESAAIVQWRTIFASLFLAMLYLIKKQKPNFEAIKRNKKPLLLSGIVLGANWAFLFLAYQHSSVGMSTILYYFAPVLVFIFAPLFFKEKPSALQIIGIVAAISGTIFTNFESLTGGNVSLAVLYAMLAAVFYATVMLCNSSMHEISGLDSTFIQLIIAAVVMTIYCTITTGNMLTFAPAKDMLIVLLLGVVHTGMIFPLYFFAIQKLPAQNIAIFSYIDPASALIFSYIFLNENLSALQITGAIFVFGGALFAQLQGSKKQQIS